MFQSAPHFSSEANSVGVPRRRSTSRFNPRLTSAARRTTPVGWACPQSYSYNPRLTSAARRSFHPLSILRKKEFQSAPHFSSEANSLEREESEKLGKFQSAPHFSSEANAIVSWH